jgi:hypothetical protein
MPKRVLVPSLKVKRLIKLFDSSPTKMAKGKKTGTSAGASATKSAAALAHMVEELGREEAAANDQAAPAASTGPAARDIQTPKGSAQAPGVASTPKGDMAAMAKSSIMKSFLNNSERTRTKKNRGEWCLDGTSTHGMT